jgi:hypothetical protein
MKSFLNTFLSSWNEECGFKRALFQTARKLLKNIHKMPFRFE